MKSLSDFFSDRKVSVTSVLFFLLVGWTYLPSLQNGFVNLDDPAFVYSNPYVQGGITWQGVKWAFTTMDRGFWQPLAWLSLMLDSQLFGAKAGGYHFTSLLLHAITTVLLFHALRRMTGSTGRSACVAALFGLHPLHVESVAWVSERKDVLSALFWVLTMLMYVRYTKSRERLFAPNPSSTINDLPALDSRRSALDYPLTLVFFVCGLMSKSMVVTLPLILLLMDWWPLGRVELSKFKEQRSTFIRLLKEKLPFFLLALVFGILTIVAQKSTGAVKDTEYFPLSARVANAVCSYIAYLYQMIWPRSLAAFYSYPRRFPALMILGAVALLAGVTLAAVLSRRRYPYIAFGWTWYVATLLPVIGLLQVGSQAHADRYTYIPLIGIFVALAWGIHDLTRKVPNQAAALATAATVVILICMIVTREQIGYWKNSEVLFSHALKVTKDNELAHNNYGTTMFRSRRVDEAIFHFREAIRIKPRYAVAHANLGSALITKGRYEEAISQLQEAIRISPKYAGAFRNIGNALGQQGKIDEAIPYFQKAIALDPADGDAHYGYGLSLFEKGRGDEALSEYRKAVQLNPSDSAAQANLGSTLLLKGNLDEAIVHLDLAIRAGGSFPAAYRNLGTALARKGRLDEGLLYLQKAVSLAPRDVDAHYNLGVALLQKGYLEEGITQFREVLKLNPSHAAAQKNLNVALGAKASQGTSEPTPPKR